MGKVLFNEATMYALPRNGDEQIAIVFFNFAKDIPISEIETASNKARGTYVEPVLDKSIGDIL